MILLLFVVCCYRPLLKVYETSQLGLIALHIFRVWHGTIRCNRCGSEPLLLVDCCVLCSVITVSTAFIARLSIGKAFIARLSIGTALWLVFQLGRRSSLVSSFAFGTAFSACLEMAFIAHLFSIGSCVHRSIHFGFDLACLLYLHVHW